MKMYALCIRGSNSDQTADIQLRKVYEVLPSEDVQSAGMMRIMDDSGEDYLYPLYCFLILLIKRLNNAMILYSKLSLLVFALLFSVMQVKAQSWQQAVKGIKERAASDFKKDLKYARLMEEERERGRSSEEKITWEVIRELGELEYTPEKGIPTQRYLTDEEKLSAYKKEIAEKSDVKKRAFLDFVQILLQKFDLVKDFPKVDWEKGFTPPIQPTGDKQKDKILQDARKFNDSVYVFGHITQSLLIDKSNEEGKKNAFYNSYQVVVARKARKQQASAIQEVYRAQALELQKAFDFIPAKPEEADKNFVAEFFSDLTWIHILSGQLGEAQKSIKISYGLIYGQDSDLRRKVEINLAHLAMLNQEFEFADSLYLVHALIPISEGNSIGVMWADVIEDNFNAMKDLFIPIPHSDSILAVIQKKRISDLIPSEDVNTTYSQIHLTNEKENQYSWSEDNRLTVKISPNGRLVAKLPCNLPEQCKLFTLYDARTGVVVKRFSRIDSKEMIDIQFTPNSRMFTWLEVIDSPRRAIIKGYDIVSNTLGIVADFILPDRLASVSSRLQFAIHPQGKIAVIGSYKELVLFDIQTSKQLGSLSYPENEFNMHLWSNYRGRANSLTFSDDGKLFYLSQYDKLLRLYQIKETQSMSGNILYDIALVNKFSNVLDVTPSGIIATDDNERLAISKIDSLGSLNPIFKNPFSSFQRQGDNKSLKDSTDSKGFMGIFPDGRHIIRRIYERLGTGYTYIQNLFATLEVLTDKVNNREKEITERQNKNLVHELTIFKNDIAKLQEDFSEKKYAKDYEYCLRFRNALKNFPEYRLKFTQFLKSVQADSTRTDTKLLSKAISESDELASQFSKQIPQMLPIVESKFDKLQKGMIQEVGSLLRKAEVAEEEYKLKKGLVLTEKEFRKRLKIGSRCSKGIILQVKGDAVLVQPVNGNASNAKWYNFSEIEVFR